MKFERCTMNTSNIHKQADYVLYNHPIDWGVINSNELHEEHVEIEEDYGRLSISQWSFDGILIRHTKTWFRDNKVFENRNEINAVGLEFNITGQYDIFHVGNTYNVFGNQHNIIYTPEVNNTFKNNDLYGENFKIYFKPEIFLDIVSESNSSLESFCQGVLAKRPTVIANVSPVISPALLNCIHEILHCKFTGNMKRVFLRSKCLEILVLQADAFNTDHKLPSLDEKKIENARDFLIENFKNPPTLEHLSKEVGLNEFKLKRDFKSTYNSTVFAFVSEYRMEQARMLILKSQKSISEIAYDLGYSSPQHFSTAFKKRFGVSPGDLRNI